MPVGYKIDILAALKAAGYSSICKLLQCQPGDILEYTEEPDTKA